MSVDPPFYHDKKYQCWCGINAERAAFVVGVLGIIWSCLTFSVASVIAYVCVIIAIKTKNPSFYIVFYVVSGFAIILYIVAIVLLALWLAQAHGGDDGARTFYSVILAFAVVELFLQFWVIWIMKRARAYTKAARDYRYANQRTHHYQHPHASVYPAAYSPYTATPIAFGSPLSPPVYSAEPPYPETIRHNSYPQPQPAFQG
ncbi:hypothetical protein AAVH_29550 [Aphelenchoides avenae]|nr:hypothetical protein AAVH_29550 [Aphelenchus avenae]